LLEEQNEKLKQEHIMQLKDNMIRYETDKKILKTDYHTLIEE
jgi:hypothetical protein